MKKRVILLCLMIFLAFLNFSPPNRVSASTTTIYASSEDGYIYYTVSSSTDDIQYWYQCRDASSGDGVNKVASAVGNAIIVEKIFDEKIEQYTWRIHRVFLDFDTSSLPDNAVITNASVHVYGYYAAETDVGILEGTQGDTLEAADYDAYTGDVLATVDSWSTSSYNVFYLSDYDCINPTGKTYFCLREYTHDISNSSPATNSHYRAGCHFSEETGTTYDPYLYLEYTTNNPPSQSDENPTNGSTTSVNPTLSVKCIDTDEDVMTAYWYSNSSGSWVQFGYNSSILTGDYIYQTNSNFSSYDTTYWWSVNLTDGTAWCNETYHFTTESAPGIHLFYLRSSDPTHGQPTSSSDIGSMLATQPTTLEYRKCGSWVAFFYDDENYTFSTVNKLYVHSWWHVETKFTHEGGYYNGSSAGYNDILDTRTFWCNKSSDIKENVYDKYLSVNIYFDISCTPEENKYNFSTRFRTAQSSTNIGVFSSPEYQSYVIINFPDNSTLQSMDSDSDGLSDYNEMFVNFTNPMDNDTDNDGYNDNVDAYPNDKTRYAEIEYGENSVEVVSSTNDGHMYKTGSSWSSVHDATSYDSNDTTSAEFKIGDEDDRGTYNLYRGILYFDTSNIPDDADIKTACIKLYGQNLPSETNHTFICTVNGQPVYPHEPVISSDFNIQHYSGNGSWWHTGNFISDDYIEIELTNTSWINKTGTTKLVLISKNDYEDNTPAADNSYWFSFASSDSSYKPKLNVTYNLPLTVTVNIAGNPGDYGRPYRNESMQTTLNYLQEEYQHGTYVSNSNQSESFLYINTTVTGAVAVKLHLLDDGVWDNTSYSFTNTGGDYWEINVTGLSGKISFDINASNETSYLEYKWRHKVAALPSDTWERRYFNLSCPVQSSTKFEYSEDAVFYFYTAPTYSDVLPNKLDHDQGSDGGQSDVGFLYNSTPTDTVHKRYCGDFVAYWMNQQMTIPKIDIDNIYLHFWWDTGSNNIYVGLNQSAWIAYAPAQHQYTTASANAKSNITYGGKTYHLETKKWDVSSYGYNVTDNSIYQLLLTFYDEDNNPYIVSNRSFTSFVLFNLPVNDTLAGMDSDSDGRTDYQELFIDYTNPFLSDTDNDGHSDYEEYQQGSDPNDYLSTPEFIWIDITNDTWSLGSVVMGSSTYTNETGVTFIADMDNTTVNTDLKLQITSDATDWSAATSGNGPGADVYRLNASVDTWSTEAQIVTASATTISTDIPAGQNETFDLRFDAPTSTSTGDQQSITVTASLVKH